MSNLTRYEQETIILYNEGEKTASVYTHNRALIRRLDELSQTNPDCRKVKETAENCDYIVPKKWVTVRSPRQLNISEEQREAARERGKALHAQATA